MSLVAASAAEVRSTGPASKTGDVRSRTFQFVTTLGVGRHKRRKALHLTMTFESERANMSTPLQASVGSDLAADLLDTVLTSLDDSKAEDLVTLDIAGKSSLADHMVIVSGRSHRHVGAIADHLLKDLKSAGQWSCNGGRSVHLRLGADRCGRCDCSHFPSGSPRFLQS